MGAVPVSADTANWARLGAGGNSGAHLSSFRATNFGLDAGAREICCRIALASEIELETKTH
jgi:hypothetical protein